VPNSWANSAAFAYAPYGSFGNTPRYISELRGPHYHELGQRTREELDVQREHESPVPLRDLQLLNHPNFYAPGPANMSLYNPGTFSEKSRTRSLAELSSLPASSTGNPFVNNCFKLMLVMLLPLLVKPLPGLGQQTAATTLESLVAAAQQAQAANDYARQKRLTNKL
jgi:hypothetical protein